MSNDEQHKQLIAAAIAGYLRAIANRKDRKEVYKRAWALADVPRDAQQKPEGKQ